MKTLPRDFWLLCLSSLLFILSFNLILPELNQFLEEIGEGKSKWAVLVPWTISAMLLRPLSGKMSDVIGRKFVINLGIIISIAAAFFYPYALLLNVFVVLRFFHGFGAGFQPTGASSLAADLIPEKIRGEAMGFFSIAISLGFGFGQALSEPIKSEFGINGLFYAVAVFGVCAFLIMIPIKETQPKKSNFKMYHVIPKWNELIGKEVLVPTIIMLLITVCTGFYMLLIPDIAQHLDMENKGWFFFTHMISSLIVRYLAGRLSDRIGRRKSLILGVAIFLIATVIMIGVNSVFLFLTCGFIYGVGTGVISPTLMAWTTDLTNPDFKGRGLATLWMGLELGLMIGSFIGMWMYQNEQKNLYAIFIAASIILLMILIYLMTAGKRIPISYKHNTLKIKQESI